MGRIIYGQWIILIEHYFKILRFNEFTYEIVIPLISACLASYIYNEILLDIQALSKLREMLPTAISVLIGFTIMAITLLSASESNTITNIKNRESRASYLNGKLISIYKLMLIMFSYALIVEIFFLLVIFFVAFLINVYTCPILVIISLFLEIFLLLHILLLIVRSVTSLYLVLYHQN